MINYIDKYGNKIWKNDENKYHREDGPAFESKSGLKFWYKNGKLHRDNGPAAEYLDGEKRWYKNGKLHREDGPAKKYADGTEEWWLHGKPYINITNKKIIHINNFILVEDD